MTVTESAMANERLTSGIHDRLAGLRGSLRRRLAREAAARMMTCLVVSVFVTLAFDYTLHMERPLRAIMMALAAAALAWTAYRRLIAPLLTPMTADELALLVESRYSHLGDRLISAIQFARGRNAGQSGAMVLRVTSEAGELMRDLDMKCLVDRARLRRLQTVAACLLTLLVGFSLWRTDVMKLWLRRNIAFAEVDWPQDTYLTVRGGPDFTVLRGDDFKLVIAAGGNVIPSQVILHARYPSVGWTEERLEPASRGRRTYVKVFRAVAERFAFYVTGGDDSRDKRREHNVTVIDPPAIDACSFVVEYPAYMNRQPTAIDGSHGVLSVPVASTLQVTASSTKPLRSAALMLDGKEAGSVRRTGRLSFVGRFSVDPPEGGAGGAAALRVLRFALTDTDGYSSRGGQKYAIEVRADRAPSVDLRKRAVRGVVTDRAIIPLIIAAEDDCGLAAARAVLSAGSRKIKRDGLDIPLPPPVSRRRKVSLRRDIDLQGRGLAAGDVLRLGVEFTDTLPPSLGGPNRGRGGPLTFRVIKPEDLMAELVRRQKSLRLEFMQAIALQRGARDRINAVRAMLSLSAGKVAPEASRRVKAAAGSQKSVASECAKAADVMAAVLLEMTYNRLGSGPQREEMQSGIIAPLRNLAQPIARVAALLNLAAAVKDAPAMDSRIEAVAGLQDDILAAMAEILDRMQKLETRQDMINTLQLILKWSEQQLKSIEKKRDDEVGDVFDDASGDAGGGK